MAAHLNTPSKTTAFAAAASVIAPVRVRDRIAASCAGSGTAEQMYGLNAADVDALVARYLR
jgi:hypothetical protein